VLQQAGVLVHAYQPPAEPSPPVTVARAATPQAPELADPTGQPTDHTEEQP
jgi:hypothetical protein